MKLQNLIIIFIIILIPIILIFSLYLNLETKTIVLQTDYDEKLIEATKEAVEAFEINTVEWTNKFSTLANVKRRDLMSSINVFTTSLSDKLGIGGTSQENILSYIPAIVYTMYDGYYIYSPTHVPITIGNSNGVQVFYYKDAVTEETRFISQSTQNIGGTWVAGEPMYLWDNSKGTATGVYNAGGSNISFTTESNNAKKTYKHVLKTFIPYAASKEINGNMYVINYTLDNYVRIYGNNELRQGYILSNTDFGKISIMSNDISNVTFDDKNITKEVLEENIAFRSGYLEEINTGKYSYIYTSNNDKRYYDNTNGQFFNVNDSYVKEYLGNSAKVGDEIAEYKKILVCTNDGTGEFIELYQLINGTDNNWYFINTAGEYERYFGSVTGLGGISKYEDCSAINYYVENYAFNKWLRSSVEGLGLNDDEIQDILSKKNEVIIEDINNNLNLSISNYRDNSSINYKLPEITAKDWEQALSNISMITFLQGNKIGLKTYNNYVVVTSTHNNEYVGEESLYYSSNEDNYYHRYGCTSVDAGTGSPETAYRNTEYKVQRYSYKNADDTYETKYYYKHNNSDISKLQCFNCIVNRNNINEDTTNYNTLHYRALARERYIQMSKISLNMELYKKIESIQFNETESWIPVESYGSTRSFVLLTPTLTPSNATNKSLVWTSSDNNIATVNANGKVTAKSPGKVTITATAKNDSNIKASVDVYVYNAVYTWTEERQLWIGYDVDDYASINFPSGLDYLILDNTYNVTPSNLNDISTGASYYCIKYSKNNPGFNQENGVKYFFKTYYKNGGNLCHTFFAVAHDGKDIESGGNL